MTEKASSLRWEVMEERKRSLAAIELHREMLSQASEDLKFLNAGIKELECLTETRRRLIQKRWDTRKELRVAKNKLIDMRKSGEIKRLCSSAFMVVQKSSVEVESKIIRKAFEIDRSVLRSGVYFLLSGKNVVYVGQAVKMLRRIGDHSEKQFDRIAFIPCHESELNEIERAFINLLDPVLNIDGSTMKTRREINGVSQ